MNETKYKQRVRQRAQEFATEQYRSSFYAVQIGPPMPMIKFNPENPMAKRAIASMIENFIPAARLSVQREAEAYTSGYSIGRDMENDPYSRAGLKTMLQSLGLVPENDEG